MTAFSEDVPMIALPVRQRQFCYNMPHEIQEDDPLSLTDRSYYHYDLPEDRIAQHPADRRDASRLLVLDGRDGSLRHRMFSDLPEYLCPGDCLVLNNTRVMPARLLGQREDTGTPVEVLLLKQTGEREW